LITLCIPTRCLMMTLIRSQVMRKMRIQVQSLKTLMLQKRKEESNSTERWKLRLNNIHLNKRKGQRVQLRNRKSLERTNLKICLDLKSMKSLSCLFILETKIKSEEITRERKIVWKQQSTQYLLGRLYPYFFSFDELQMCISWSFHAWLWCLFLLKTLHQCLVPLVSCLF